MKTEMTMETTGVMIPKSAKASLNQTIWQTSPLNPEKKNRKNRRRLCRELIEPEMVLHQRMEMQQPSDPRKALPP